MDTRKDKGLRPTDKVTGRPLVLAVRPRRAPLVDFPQVDVEALSTALSGKPHYAIDDLVAPYAKEPPAAAEPVDGRGALLAEAADAVGRRAGAYGSPEDNFGRIARHWIAYFKNRFDIAVALLPQDVALLMDLVKTSRLEHDIHHHDSWVDKAGYAACGAAIKANMERGA